MPALGAAASISIISNPVNCKNILAFEKGCDFIHSSQVSTPEVKSLLLGGAPGASAGLLLASLGQLASVLIGRRKEALKGPETVSKEKTSSPAVNYKLVTDAPASGLVTELKKNAVSSRPKPGPDENLQYHFLRSLQLLNPGPSESNTLEGQRINCMRSYYFSQMLGQFHLASEDTKNLIVQDLRNRYELEQNL